MINSPPPSVPRKSWLDRIQALFEVLLMSGLVSGFLASFPLLALVAGNSESLVGDARIIALSLLLESAFSLLILILILQLRGEPFSSLGLHLDRWKFQTALGLGLIPFLFFVNVVVAVVFKYYFPEHYLEENPLSKSIRSPGELALFIFAALIAGAIKEELQRAFILNRFRDYLGGAVVGLVFWSLAFGAGHYVQGYQGIATTTLLGLLFGIVYLKTRSLIGPIVAHGTYNTIALLAYWFFAPR